MRRWALAILIAAVAATACNSANDAETPKRTIQSTDTAMSDTTPRVTGIGGIFFRSSDPEATRTWYSENLGISTTEYGATFETRNADRPDEVNYLQWSPFPDSTDYFEPSQKQFMINYRVQNLAAMVENLRAAGVVIVDSIQEYDYGKFVHIMDPDGNKIELWEPVDRVLSGMDGETNK